MDQDLRARRGRRETNRVVKALVFLEHHRGRFDDDGYFVALLEAKLLRALTGDDAFDAVLSDLDDDVSHDLAEGDFGDLAFELVAGGERHSIMIAQSYAILNRRSGER